jgi:hypothetical protein
MVGLVPQVRGKGDAVAEMLRYIWKEVQTDPLPGINKLSVSMAQEAARQAEKAGPSPGTSLSQPSGGDHLNILV